MDFVFHSVIYSFIYLCYNTFFLRHNHDMKSISLLTSSSLLLFLYVGRPGSLYMFSEIHLIMQQSSCYFLPCTKCKTCSLEWCTYSFYLYLLSLYHAPGSDLGDSRVPTFTCWQSSGRYNQANIPAIAGYWGQEFGWGGLIQQTSWWRGSSIFTSEIYPFSIL